jgi:hypothetical protein
LGDIKASVSSLSSPNITLNNKPKPDTKLVEQACADLLRDNKYPNVMEYLTGTNYNQRHIKAEVKIEMNMLPLYLFLKKGFFFIKVLRKYGVGAKYYPFKGSTGETSKELCITFPWISGIGENRVIHRVKYRSVNNKHMMRLDPAGGEWGE